MGAWRRNYNVQSTLVKGAVKMFFDRPHVIRAIGKMEARALMRIGGFMRVTMRNLLSRQGSKPRPHSRPGDPPYRHLGHIRRMVQFAYEPMRSSMVVGPELWPRRGDVNPTTARTVPQLLDTGGTAYGPAQWVIWDRQHRQAISYYSKGGKTILRSKKWQRDQQRKKPNRNRRYHPLKLRAGIRRYEPRPFRAPVMAIALRADRLRRAFQIARQYRFTN